MGRLMTAGKSKKTPATWERAYKLARAPRTQLEVGAVYEGPCDGHAAPTTDYVVVAIGVYETASARTAKFYATQRAKWAPGPWEPVRRVAAKTLRPTNSVLNAAEHDHGDGDDAKSDADPGIDGGAEQRGAARARVSADHGGSSADATDEDEGCQEPTARRKRLQRDTASSSAPPLASAQPERKDMEAQEIEEDQERQQQLKAQKGSQGQRVAPKQAQQAPAPPVAVAAASSAGAERVEDESDSEREPVAQAWRARQHLRWRSSEIVSDVEGKARLLGIDTVDPMGVMAWSQMEVVRFLKERVPQCSSIAAFLDENPHVGVSGAFLMALPGEARFVEALDRYGKESGRRPQDTEVFAQTLLLWKVASTLQAMLRETMHRRAKMRR
eukprot:m51a1_g10285 hypothetical protein (385) ;mRNA; f:96885-98662